MKPTGAQIFFSLSIVSLLAILRQITPPSVKPIIKASLTTHQGEIKTIDTPRSVGSTRSFYIDILDFDGGNALVHSKLGPMGFNHDFFIDFAASFEVLRKGNFIFYIESDDGFRLLIDETKVSEFPGDRPMELTEGKVHLEEGLHTMKLSYFQGYGLMGLRGKYGREFSNEKYFIGSSSPDIKFIRFNEP